MKTTAFLIVIYFTTLGLSAQFSNEQIASYPHKAEVKQIDPFQFAYYEYRGSYMNAYTAFPNLVEYINSQRVDKGLYSLGVYYDNPDQVAENDLRSEIGMMVKEKVNENDTYKYKKVGGFKAATIKYNNMEEIPLAYSALMKYIETKKLTPVGPAYEFYYTYEGTEIDAEIIIPVK